MILKDYLWLNRKTQAVFLEETELAQRSLSQYIYATTSPSLLSALKIMISANGEITGIDLLSNKDSMALEKFLKKMKPSQLVDDMLQAIAETRKSREKKYK